MSSEDVGVAQPGLEEHEQLDYEAELHEEETAKEEQTKEAEEEEQVKQQITREEEQEEDGQEPKDDATPIEAKTDALAPSSEGDRPARISAPEPELPSSSDEESLEEGEVSDEDEETRKERLKPQPVCRFYSKGQCAWGASCRFLHPGVLDKGNYSMFSEPKPILPGAEEVIAASTTTPEKKAPAEEGAEEEGTETGPALPPPPPRPETAWERGLRQAKEMRRKSQQRKETDAEYEEKRTTMSLTQAEIDKENDYYARKASPLHEDNFSDYDDPYEPPPTTKRIAPPPPEDFYNPAATHYPDRPTRYPPPAPPIPSGGGGRYADDMPSRRRVAPPRSPEPDSGRRSGGGGGRRGADDSWEDPWMRSGGGRGGRDHDRNRGEDSRGRRQSYSSQSSRSSSSSTSRSRSRSRGRDRKRKGFGRRGRSSSNSSNSSRSSSSPENIPRRKRPSGSPPRGGRTGLTKSSNANTAPLQKRLGGLAKSSAIRKIKKEPEDKGSGASRRPLSPPRRRRRSSSGSSSRSRSRSSSPLPHRPRRIKTEPGINKPSLAPEVSMDKNQSGPSRARPTPASDKPISSRPVAVKLTLKSNTTKPVSNKQVLEKLGMDEPGPAGRKRKGEEEEEGGAPPAAGGPVKKKEKKTAVDRREELMKQLKAVENAIAKKRTKL